MADETTRSSYSPDPDSTPVERALMAHLHGLTPPDAELTPDERQLVDDLLPWLDALHTAAQHIAEDQSSASDNQVSEPVRADDPVAIMLGLVPDPNIVVNGRKLATARKKAGLDLKQLLARLRMRGWEFSAREGLQWEMRNAPMPPAIIKAIADELGVRDTDLVTTARTGDQTPDLFDDARVSAYLDDWAAQTGVEREYIRHRASSTLAGAVHRNKTTGSAEALLAVLRVLRSIPDFLDKP